MKPGFSGRSILYSGSQLMCGGIALLKAQSVVRKLCGKE